MISRPARPSASVLTAIADALRLDTHERERRIKRFRHPRAGPLTLHSTSLLMADDPMLRIVILYPAAASDAAKLECLS